MTDEAATKTYEAKVTKLGDEIADTVRNNPIVRIPGHLVLVGRVLGLLSGVSRSLDSRIDLARTVFPYVLGMSTPTGGAPH